MIQWSYEVGDSEGENCLDLLFHRQTVLVPLTQHGQIALGHIENLIQLCPIELLGDDPVIRIPLLWQEGTLLQTEKHILIGWTIPIRNRGIFHYFFQIVGEFFLVAPFELCRAVLLLHRGNVLGIGHIVVFLYQPKNLRIFFRMVGAQKVLEILQIRLMLLINSDLRLGDTAKLFAVCGCHGCGQSGAIRQFTQVCQKFQLVFIQCGDGLGKNIIIAQ